jgi:Ca-activated chloride channel family protein
MARGRALSDGGNAQGGDFIQHSGPRIEMMMKMKGQGRVWLLALGLAVPGLTFAQDGITNSLPERSEAASKEDAQEPPASTPIRVRSDLVVTPVTVLGSTGEFVYSLKKEDFEIYDNGKPQRIEGFESEPRRAALVIVVQTTRAIAPLIKNLESLSGIFSNLLLGPEGVAAVVTYSDRVRVVQDFTSDANQLQTTLGNLGPEGVGARLNDALTRAIALLERRPKEDRRLIVAFSTGFDDGSESERAEVVRRATGSEVAIYGLGLNPVKSLFSRRPEDSPPTPVAGNPVGQMPTAGSPTPSLSSRVYSSPIPVVDILDATGKMVKSVAFKHLMEYYAGYTGGVFYGNWKKDELADLLSRIAAEINSQYELAYVPNTLDEPGFHRIQVRVLRPGLQVRARSGYFYQPGATPVKPGEKAKPIVTGPR